MLAVTSSAFADGTEALGAPSIAIAEGSGVSIGGVGLSVGSGCPDAFVPGDITVDVPAGATVQQVLMYWVGASTTATGDDSATVDGNPVTGTLIGGVTDFADFFCDGLGQTVDVQYSAYRADITGLGLFGPGSNTVSVDDLDGFDFVTDGAGILVIWDDGSANEIQIMDGLDMAFFQFNDPLDATTPVVFSFDASDTDRIAHLPNFVGSVHTGRPNVTEIITNGPNGETTTLFDIFNSNQGPDYDALTIPVTIPAGSTELSIELISADGTEPLGFPASFAWHTSGLVIEEPEEVECGECDGKVTHLELEFQGADGTTVKVVQKSQGNQHPTIFNQTVNNGDIIILDGVDIKNTLGPEIVIYEDGVLAAKIHTSCSQPIGPGLVVGNYEVLSGESRNGGTLCPVETPPPGPEDCECDGKVTFLTLQYNGAAAATIVVKQNDGTTVYDNSVNPGGQFTFSGVDQQGTLGPEITITTDGGNPINIHTSCSQPIGPGLVRGDFEVIEGASRNGGELCPLETVSLLGFNPVGSTTATAPVSSPVLKIASASTSDVSASLMPRAIRSAGFAGVSITPTPVAQPAQVVTETVVEEEAIVVDEGALVALELAYNGAVTTLVTAMQVVDGQLVTLFDGEVGSEASIHLSGVDAIGSFGSAIYLYEDGALAASISTAVDAISVGAMEGNFEVVAGQVMANDTFMTL